MLTEQEKDELLKKIKEIKENIRLIRQDLDKINAEKEQWFSKKDSFRKEIQDKLNSVKNLKHQRNDLTSQVKLSKQERENVDKKMPELQKMLQDLRAEKTRIAEKLGIKSDYMKIKKEIDMLQEKIETIPMSFNQEKKTMTLLKQKKQELKKAEEVKEIEKKIVKTSQELDLYKNIRNISHSKVQSIAKDSQKKHVSMIEEVKYIDDLKRKESESFLKFKEFKEKIREKTILLKEELTKLSECNKKLGNDNQEIRRIAETESKKTLAEKRRVVEEKLKKKEKLTTEDLLVLQSQKD